MKKFRIEKITDGWGDRYHLQSKFLFGWKNVYRYKSTHDDYLSAKRQLDDEVETYQIRYNRNKVKTQRKYFYPPLPYEEPTV